MPTVLITGGNRGLGLEFARQYAASGWNVVATARSPQQATALAALRPTASGTVRIEPFDAARPESFDELARSIGDTALDLVINNAGVMTRRGFGASTWADWEPHMRVNAYAPLRLAEVLVEALSRGTHPKYVALTSVLGSIGANESGGLYAYRASKAAANAVLKSLSLDLATRGIVVLPLHPGWVRTDLGGPMATIDVQTSVTGMRTVIASATSADSGKFRQWDGTMLAW